MNRPKELCRDFQRGNCRYGSRCKYLHEYPQQQQQQRQPQQQQRYQQQRNQFGGGGNYYNVLGDNSNNQRQQQSQINASKEHRCNDPQICKEQIKEDMINEHPVFWRLTCYAHYKFLPNDIVGDVSPEELRALAYEGAKQGLSLKDVIQREQSMVAAKSAEFDALLRNPYKGPAQFISSPFLAPGRTSTFMPFGQPASISAAGPPQVFTQNPFPATATTPLKFGQPSGDVQFGNQLSNLSGGSPSHFRQPTNVVQQSPFASTASPALQNPFGGSPSVGPQNPFGASQSVAPQNPFGGSPSAGPQNPFGGSPSAGPQNVFSNQQVPNVPFSNTPSQLRFGSVAHESVPAIGSFPPPLGSPAPFTPPGPSPVPNTPAPVSQTLPSTPLPGALMTTEDNAIWAKAVWKIGEIPEGEPPPQERF